MNYSDCNLGMYSMSHIEMDKNQTGTKTMTLQTINKPPPSLFRLHCAKNSGAYQFYTSFIEFMSVTYSSWMVLLKSSGHELICLLAVVINFPIGIWNHEFF